MSQAPEWTVGIIGVSEADPGVDVCVADEGAGCSNIDWRFAQDPERDTVLEVEHNLNADWLGILGDCQSKGGAETVDLTAYRSATLSMDIKVVAPTAGAIDFGTYANCLWPCTGAASPFPVVSGDWQTVEIPVNDLVLGGLELSSVNIGFGLHPLVEQSNGVIYQVDNVRWSLRSPDLSDSDRDGLTDQNEIDQGLDPYSRDTDDDGLSDPDELTGDTDPLNPDTDGDGATDGFDAFPLDSSEQSDTDGDGVGDIADLDDDGDGVDDSADIFPLHQVEAAIVEADLTETGLPFGLVPYLPGAVTDPALQLGVLPQSWTLAADGSFKTNLRPFVGSWTRVGLGYRLVQPFGTTGIPVTPDLKNINWASDAVILGAGIEVAIESETRLAVLETNDAYWRIAVWEQTKEFALDPSVTLEADQPIRVYRDSMVTEMLVVSPSSQFEPFTVSELTGSWAVDALHQGENAYVDYCQFEDDECSDIVTLNADGSAIAEISGRPMSWTLSPEGFIKLAFGDTGKEILIRRLSSGTDTSTVLMSFDTPQVHVNQAQMMVKRSMPAPTAIDTFLGDVLSSGFYVTSNDDEIGYRRSKADGGLIENLGFVLNDDGTGQRIYVRDDSFQRLDLTWSLVDSRLRMEACRNCIQL